MRASPLEVREWKIAIAVVIADFSQSPLMVLGPDNRITFILPEIAFFKLLNSSSSKRHHVSSLPHNFPTTPPGAIKVKEYPEYRAVTRAIWESSTSQPVAFNPLYQHIVPIKLP